MMRALLLALMLVVGHVWAEVPDVGHWPSSAGEPVLSDSDIDVYRTMVAKAKRGVAPTAAEVAKLDNKVLLGHVRGIRLTSGAYCAGFEELSAWLKDNGDLPEAADIYAQAETRRPVVEWKEVREKVKKGTKKVHGKRVPVYKTVVKKVPAKYADMPPKPLSIVKREDARKAAEDANARALAALSDEGRALSGALWRARGKGQYAEALQMLLRPGARNELGDDRWQGELVKLADMWHGKRDWPMVLKAASAAAVMAGPGRDEALWLAGFASYRLGNLAEAARFWDKLVRAESVRSPHFAQAGWWGARAYRELGRPDDGHELLELAAKDATSFYGQIAASALGRDGHLSWDEPEVSARSVAELTRVPSVARALALAQIGEISLAQRELRLSADDVPADAMESLASLALDLHLPATALQAGRAMLGQGSVVPAALYPVPSKWNAKGGGAFDRALVLGIMRQESAFMPTAGSRVGAQGLMQIMPATANFVCRLNAEPAVGRADLHNPATNLKLAQDYLNYLSDKLDGNLVFVVASYNGGMGNVLKWQRASPAVADDPLLFIETIPFDETRDYVQKVLANYWVYQKRMGVNPKTLDALALERWPRTYASRGGGRAS